MVEIVTSLIGGLLIGVVSIGLLCLFPNFSCSRGRLVASALLSFLVLWQSCQLLANLLQAL